MLSIPPSLILPDQRAELAPGKDWRVRIALLRHHAHFLHLFYACLGGRGFIGKSFNSFAFVLHRFSLLMRSLNVLCSLSPKYFIDIFNSIYQYDNFIHVNCIIWYPVPLFHLPRTRQRRSSLSSPNPQFQEQ